MSDNRRRPRIHRTDDKHDRDLRAYADKHGIEPWRALADAIQRLAWTDGPTIDTLRADLESAREATRRADHATAAAQEAYALASTERDDLRIQVVGLGRTVDAYSAKVASLKSELAEVRAALAAKGATDRLAERVETIAADVDRRACACALPDDLAPRLAAIAARRNVEPHVMLANVIKNGISKIQASDEYQDRQKAARKARS